MLLLNAAHKRRNEKTADWWTFPLDSAGRRLKRSYSNHRLPQRWDGAARTDCKSVLAMPLPVSELRKEGHPSQVTPKQPQERVDGFQRGEGESC